MESGATTVEAAIATTLVMFLIFAIFAAALYMRAYIAVADGSSAGARAGAVASNESTADFDVLRAVDRAMTAVSRDDVVRIVVFKAEGPNYEIPAACLSGPVAGVCNVYTAQDLARAEAGFDDPGYQNDESWKATSRNVGLDVGTDSIGVYVQVKTNLVGFLSPEVKKQSVAKIEARE